MDVKRYSGWEMVEAVRDSLVRTRSMKNRVVTRLVVDKQDYDLLLEAARARPHARDGDEEGLLRIFGISVEVAEGPDKPEPGTVELYDGQTLLGRIVRIGDPTGRLELSDL